MKTLTRAPGIRPLCAHCNVAYGQRRIERETIYWPVGQLKPKYEGNMIHIRDMFEYQTTGQDNTRRMTCQRELWDGEHYWGGSPPFCTLRCAYDYARKAFKKWGPVT